MVLVLNIIGLIVYIPSRLVIVILAVLSLRSPGEKALEDIDWTELSHIFRIGYIQPSVQWETQLFHSIIIWSLFSGFHSSILAFLAHLTQMAGSH